MSIFNKLKWIGLSVFLWMNFAYSAKNKCEESVNSPISNSSMTREQYLQKAFEFDRFAEEYEREGKNYEQHEAEYRQKAQEYLRNAQALEKDADRYHNLAEKSLNARDWEHMQEYIDQSFVLLKKSNQESNNASEMFGRADEMKKLADKMFKNAETMSQQAQEMRVLAE